MSKVIAVVGLGNISLRHRRNLKMLFPQAKVIAVPARMRKVNHEVEWADCVLVDINALIDEQPDFVIIASPSSAHVQHASILMKAGIPLLIEKPVTADYHNAKKLLSLQEQYNTPISVGYCLRYLPSAMVMKKLLMENKIGSVYNGFIHIGQYLPDWRPNTNYVNSVSASKKLGGGVLLELSHELDYITWLFGALDIEQVILRGSKALNVDTEAFADISLSHHSGALFHIHLDFLQQNCQRNCSIIGSEGRLDWDLLSNTITYYHNQRIEVLYSEPDWDKNEMYIELIKDFIAFVDNKPTRIITLKEAVETVQLIDEMKLKAKWRDSV